MFKRGNTGGLLRKRSCFFRAGIGSELHERETRRAEGKKARKIKLDLAPKGDNNLVADS